MRGLISQFRSFFSTVPSIVDSLSFLMQEELRVESKGNVRGVGLVWNWGWVIFCLLFVVFDRLGLGNNIERASICEINKLLVSLASHSGERRE